MIRAHGGRLIDRFADSDTQYNWQVRIGKLPGLTLNRRETNDLEMIATGALSPLEGFMGRDDYDRVCGEGRLVNGLPWTLPITLSASAEATTSISAGSPARLIDADGTTLAVIEVDELYRPDKTLEAARVLRTTDAAHPGVSYLKQSGEIYVGGRITLLQRPGHDVLERYRLDPKETRVLFRAKGWNSVAAFQTRNPIHRAHEYLQKCALEMVDALLIHPVMGETKPDDIPPEVRLECYKALLSNYYPKDRVALSILPAAMRYAGPREAVFHAIVRKNYGCTHFIVGRDHAGVGGYYGTDDAHTIFREFDRLEIGIVPLFFDHAFYCHSCGNMASQKTCPHAIDQHVFLSGTRIREMLQNGEELPPEFTRPEVAAILREHYDRATGANSSEAGRKTPQ